MNWVPGDAGREKSATLIESALERARDDTLRSFVTVAGADSVRRQTERSSFDTGELAGLPLVVKDNIHVAGIRNTAATASLRSFVPADDAPSIGRLRARGMVVIGKTNMHELALGVTSAYSASGPVENAVHPGRVAGGSSGGTATAVGSGICSHGLGTDTGGSVRIPSAFNDIWGFRPSTGRYESGGITSIAYTRDTVGAMCSTLRAVQQLDTALSVMSGGGAPQQDAILRIGVDENDLAACDDAVRAAFAETVRTLRRSSACELVSVNMAALDGQLSAVEPRLGAQELVPSLTQYLNEYPELPSLERVLGEADDPHVVELLEQSRAAITAGVWNAQWQDLLTECARGRAAYVNILRGRRISAILRPTVPFVPPLLSEVLRLGPTDRGAQFVETTSFARTATVVGAPSLSLPLGPLLGHSSTGVILDGLPGCDVELLSHAETVARELRGGRD